MSARASASPGESSPDSGSTAQPERRAQADEPWTQKLR